MTRILFLNKAPKNATAYDIAGIEKLLNSYASPGTRVELGFPDNFAGSQVEERLGSQKMLNGLDHMMEVPALIRKILWAQDNGYDAVIQSNTFDPGVDGGRLVVRIPVIGPLRTTMHAAAVLADRIGITVPLASHVPYTWRLVRTIGMDHLVTDIRPIETYGPDLKERRAEITAHTIEVIKRLVKDTGAEIIVPLGGAIIPYVVDPVDLQNGAGVPVLNTKSISIRFAETCVALGLTHSPLTYPRAKLKADDFVREI